MATELIMNLIRFITIMSSLEEQQNYTIGEYNPLPESNPAAVDAVVVNESNLIFDKLVDLIFNKKVSVLLLGFGGSGKSHVIRQLVAHGRTLGTHIDVAATTGVAAVNINGQTIHRFFGIGFAKEDAETLINKIRCTRKDAAARIAKSELLIIDEVSMLSNKLWAKLDKICKAIRKCDSPFGGLQVLISGDFLQLPPVEDKWVFKSRAWKAMNFVPVFLTEPKRFTDESYVKMLLGVREGYITTANSNKLRSRVTAYNEYMKLPLTADSVKPTKIYPHRAKAEDENVRELEALPGVQIMYRARDTFESQNPRTKATHYSDVYDNLAPEYCRLKVGAQVMLTYNVDVEEGLCNGSRGVVLDCLTDRVVVKFIAQKEPVIVDYQEFTFEDDTVKIIRFQIPLMLAWAQTIHKSQGSTIDFCVADIGPDVFAPGQAYVALSRARSWDSLMLRNYSPKSIIADQQALEYVNKLEQMSQQTDVCQPDIN